jgi:hypothetical protein
MKPLARLLAIIALLFAVTSGVPEPLEAQAGTCCVQKFVSCAASCECGVAGYACTLDFPGCTAFCTCRACP